MKKGLFLNANNDKMVVPFVVLRVYFYSIKEKKFYISNRFFPRCIVKFGCPVGTCG